MFKDLDEKNEMFQNLSELHQELKVINFASPHMNDRVTLKYLDSIITCLETINMNIAYLNNVVRESK